jgi:hypothetical protein
LLTGYLRRESVSQPSGSCETLKYLSRRLAVAPLVGLKATKFGTHPAIEPLRKFNKGRIKEGPGQVAQIIHRGSIKERATMVNMKPNAPGSIDNCGIRSSLDFQT